MLRERETSSLLPFWGSVRLSVFPPVRPALLVRAARHYEGAEQILIRQAVMTARHFVSTQPVELPAPGQWVVTECPARVDFSGEFLRLGMGNLRVRLAGSVTILLNCYRGLE